MGLVVAMILGLTIALMLPAHVLQSEVCGGLFFLVAIIMILCCGHWAFGSELPPLGSGAQLKNYCFSKYDDGEYRANGSWLSWKAQEDNFFSMLCRTFKTYNYERLLALLAIGAAAVLFFTLAGAIAFLPSNQEGKLEDVDEITFSGTMAAQGAHAGAAQAVVSIAPTLVCSAGSDGALKVWSVPESGALLPVASNKQAHGAEINAMTVATDIAATMGGATLLVTASSDGSVRVWVASNLKPVQTLHRLIADQVRHVAVFSLVAA